MKTGQKSAAATAPAIIISIFLLIVTPLFWGCSTGRGGKQKKKVAIAIFENKTFFDTPSFNRVYHQDL